MGNISNGRVQKIGHFRKLSNYRELLICALEPLNKYPSAARGGAHKSYRVNYPSL